MNPNEIIALNNVLNYMIPVEKKHWEECGKPKAHIYTDLCILQQIAAEIDEEMEGEMD